MAQQTNITKIPSMAKYDQTGSEPSEAFRLDFPGFRESMALSKAFFDLREAGASFCDGGVTFCPFPMAYPQVGQPFVNFPGVPVVPQTGQRTDEKNFPQCLHTLAFCGTSAPQFSQKNLADCFFI